MDPKRDSRGCTPAARSSFVMLACVLACACLLDCLRAIRVCVCVTLCVCRDGVFVHLGECLLFVWVSQPESVVTCPATSVQHVTKVCMFAIISSAHGTIKSANTHLKTSTFASIVPLLLQHMPGEASDVCEAHLCSYLPAVRGFNARSIAQLERPEAEYRRPNLGFHALPGTLGWFTPVLKDHLSCIWC